MWKGSRAYSGLLPVIFGPREKPENWPHDISWEWEWERERERGEEGREGEREGERREGERKRERRWRVADKQASEKTINSVNTINHDHRRDSSLQWWRSSFPIFPKKEEKKLLRPSSSASLISASVRVYPTSSLLALHQHHVFTWE